MQPGDEHQDQHRLLEEREPDDVGRERDEEVTTASVLQMEDVTTQGHECRHQEGQQVFKYAVRKMYESCRDLLERNGLAPSDVQVLIPHQANRRIISAAAERLGIPCDRVIINIDRYGNTTAGTIPLATRDAIQSGKLKKGDLVMFAAVGAGYTVGANLWRWAY